MYQLQSPASVPNSPTNSFGIDSSSIEPPLINLLMFLLLFRKVLERSYGRGMIALKKNGTWELVSLPREKKIVECKWVFTVKHNTDGTAKMNSVRALLFCAANLKWPLHQFDVNNAFLHGELEEEVYMDIPPVFSSKTEGKVCRLKKALYGLKQSLRVWFGRFSKAMLGFEYKQSHADHTMFIKKGAGKIVILIVYVDDMIVPMDDVDEILNLKFRLAQEFEIKDLESLRFFLGMEMARSNKGIFISQRKYILDLLEETGMLGCRLVNSPIEANQHLSGDLGEFPNKERY
ncbi:hypothetical protein Acr_13g0003500 [Actinidia rufa]|uniref:Reverse transcriptase Ty1/copia-type domain-containing protein n=1 Tax=Actinidia rufa TaxID=165716 RepID=A0A7J0FL97_9ERIC|nr:hypothetical protein Acr_13g0003500 [Actinidia rufa]